MARATPALYSAETACTLLNDRGAKPSDIDAMTLQPAPKRYATLLESGALRKISRAVNLW